MLSWNTHILNRYVPLQEKETESEPEFVINTKAGAVFDVIADENYIYSASQNGLVQIWDIDTGLLRRVLTGHGDQVLALTQTVNYIISSSSDGTLKIWNKSNFYCVQTLSVGHEGHLSVLTAVGEGQPIFFSCHGNCVRIWALGDGFFEEEFTVHSPKRKNRKEKKNLSEKSNQKKIVPIYASGSSLILAMRDPLICALRSFISYKTISCDERMRDECFNGAKFLWKLFEQ